MKSKEFKLLDERSKCQAEKIRTLSQEVDILIKRFSKLNIHIDNRKKK